ncbi:poly-beta-1,6-N-acetyl-D-glucosamine biosynthesis protein PgaD [Vagococcus sp. WN89Y]|uniref:poly-beta-1,6-N-acetyl-D-glucosamine biosynthesis protein PgaD n=1 Tax=Vagococcus sp. WN89Y TaxID=3457258 RepID=UPI003FCE56C4
MHQPLIFTERRWFPKFTDVLLTLIAWSGFLWLIYAGMVRAFIAQPNIGPRPFASNFSSVVIYLIVAATYGGLLIIWARYNQHRFRVERRSRKPGLAHEEVAKSFHITPGVVAELNRSRLLTVHHNGFGSISSVEPHLFIPNNIMPITRTA